MSNEVHVERWRSMLRTLWTAEPSAAGAFALVRMCANIMDSAMALRHDIYGDVEVRRAEKAAAEAMDVVLLRLDWYARQIQRAVHLTQPGSVDRISMLTANVAGPILDGIYPADFPAGVEDEDQAEMMRRKLTKMPDGRWQGIGDAATSANVFNAFSRAWSLEKQHESATWLPDSLRDWLSQVERDMAPGVPGEDLTTYDKVADALEDAKNAAIDIGKGLGDALVYAALGFGTVLAIYLIWMRFAAMRKKGE